MVQSTNNQSGVKGDSPCEQVGRSANASVSCHSAEGGMYTRKPCLRLSFPNKSNLNERYVYEVGGHHGY